MLHSLEVRRSWRDGSLLNVACCRSSVVVASSPNQSQRLSESTLRLSTSRSVVQSTVPLAEWDGRSLSRKSSHSSTRRSTCCTYKRCCFAMQLFNYPTVSQIEAMLDNFIEREGSSTQDVLAACVWAEQNSVDVTCIDYLLASTEYVSFLHLMCDFKKMQEVRVSS